MSTEQTTANTAAHTAAHPTESTAVRTADETAVLQVLQRVYDAWDAADADAFVADYLEDARAITAGMHLASREELRAGMRAGFDSHFKGTTTANTVLDVRRPNPDTAIVVTETAVLFAGETAAPAERHALATWVLTRRDGRWLVASYQNSPKPAREAARTGSAAPVGSA